MTFWDWNLNINQIMKIYDFNLYSIYKMLLLLLVFIHFVFYLLVNIQSCNIFLYMWDDKSTISMRTPLILYETI